MAAKAVARKRPSPVAVASSSNAHAMPATPCENPVNGFDATLSETQPCPRGRRWEWWDPLESTCRHASLSIL